MNSVLFTLLVHQVSLLLLEFSVSYEEQNVMKCTEYTVK